jgi:SAM-dependent methyltransferase
MTRAEERRRVRRFLRNRDGSRQFECPICGFEGRFAPIGATRLHALCPRCRSRERHRLQFLVMEILASEHDFAGLDLLHIAPEPSMAAVLRPRFGSYVSGDISGIGVDRRLDLTAIDMPDASVDVVYASHVLEHIREDGAALHEVRRILRPGGFAILPVPILCDRTVEYPTAVEAEAWHVRAPGPDYFARYDVFDHVRVWTSEDFDDRHQTWAFEDRSVPSPTSPPERSVSGGARHPDYVPVGFVAAADRQRRKAAGEAHPGEAHPGEARHGAAAP